MGDSLSHLPDDFSLPWLFSYWVICWFRNEKTAIFFISWCSDMLPVQVIWLLGYLLNYIWVIYCPIYLMNPLCLGYSVIGLFVGLQMKKSANLFLGEVTCSLSKLFGY